MFGSAFANSDTEAYAGHLGKARELTKRAVDSAIRADSKEDGATWDRPGPAICSNAALEQAAYGNPAEARQSAAEVTSASGGFRQLHTTRAVHTPTISWVPRIK
ncbi:MAG: hypothetical protein WCA20_02910 [Candidatus Sulfotelmatobacter sp.]